MGNRFTLNAKGKEENKMLHHHHHHHHGHLMTALIDWEHAHDELVTATIIAIGIIALIVTVGMIASQMEPPTHNTYPMEYYKYMPYY